MGNQKHRFYGNVRPGYAKGEIKPEEVKKVLDVVRQIIREASRIISE